MRWEVTDFHRALRSANDPWKRHKSPAYPAQASARGRVAPDPDNHTQLLQLRASIKGGLLSTDSAYQAALHDLIAADPAGAMSPKALLNYIAHEPYIRAPWKINDDLPGIRSAESNPPVRQSSIRLWPNPAQRTVWVELPGDLGLANAYLQHMDGRCSEVSIIGKTMELPLGAAGTYFLHLTLSNGEQFHHKLSVQP